MTIRFVACLCVFALLGAAGPNYASVQSSHRRQAKARDKNQELERDVSESTGKAVGFHLGVMFGGGLNVGFNLMIAKAELNERIAQAEKGADPADTSSHARLLESIEGARQIYNAIQDWMQEQRRRFESMLRYVRRDSGPSASQRVSLRRPVARRPGCGILAAGSTSPR